MELVTITVAKMHGRRELSCIPNYHCLRECHWRSTLEMKTGENPKIWLPKREKLPHAAANSAEISYFLKLPSVRASKP